MMILPAAGRPRLRVRALAYRARRMSRNQGYYWVSEHAAAPEVALWCDGAWWLVGQEEQAGHRGIRVLSERLASPGQEPVREDVAASRAASR